MACSPADWADFRFHWRKSLLFHLLMQLLGVALLTPLVTAVGRLIVRASGGPVISNYDMVAFALSPAGIAFGLVVAALTITLVLAEFAGQSWIAGHAIARRPITVSSAIAFVLRKLPWLILLSARVFLRLLLLALPFAAAAGVVWFTMLQGHDINYYLAEHPPEWQRARLLAGAVAAGFALVGAWQLARWLYAVPILTFPECPREAGAGRQLSHDPRPAPPDRTTAGALVGAGGAGRLRHCVGGPAAVGGGTRMGRDRRAPRAATAGALLRGGAGGRLRLRLPAPRGAAVPGDAALCRATGRGEVAVTAHRRASIAAPENTLASFRRAMEAGADFIELDVQHTSDSQIVVLHDADFMRMGGDLRRLRDLTAAEVATIDIGSKYGPEFAGEHAPPLEQVIDMVRGINIELKYNVPDSTLAPAVVALLREGFPGPGGDHLTRLRSAQAGGEHRAKPQDRPYRDGRGAHSAGERAPGAEPGGTAGTSAARALWQDAARGD